ncbi:MAG: CHAT domain-containing protein [Blastocatellia bacterium]|nr:CHAT domain-containing protein [Blastocatellia bacterium]
MAHRNTLFSFSVGLSAILLLGAQLFSVSASADSRSPQSGEIQSLTPALPIEREIKGGESHLYQIALASNQFLRVSAEQRGVNLALTLLSPDGNKLAEADAPMLSYGVETILFIAESPGTYRLEVRVARRTSPARMYEIEVEELRPATPEDDGRTRAYREFQEAERLFKQFTNEAHREAIQKYAAASEMFESTGETFFQARALKAIGFAYEFLNEHQKAFDTYLQALPLLENAPYSQEPALTLGEIARTCRTTHRYRSALDYYRKSLDLFRALSNRKKEAETLFEIATIHNLLGESQKAINYCHESLLIAEAESDTGDRARALNYMGVVYHSLYDHQSAFYYFTQALSLFEGAGRYEEALTLYNLARVSADMGQYREALEFYDKSLALMRAFQDASSEGFILSGIGGLHFLQGDAQKALELFTRSLKLFREHVIPRGEAIVLNQIGKCHESLGDHEKAIDYFNQALKLLRAIEDKTGQAVSLYNISNIERRRGNNDSALKHIAAAIEIIESLRARVDIEQLRASFLASFQNFYGLQVELLMQAGKRQERNLYDERNAIAAFEVSERARARTLLEAIGRQRISLTADAHGELIESEREAARKLRDKAGALTRLLMGKHTEAEAANARREVETATLEHQQVKARIRQSNPRYANLVEPQPATLAEIQRQSLDADSLLLEYHLGRERSYLWAVTKTSFASFELPPSGEIEREAKRVYSLLTSRNRQVRFETVDERRLRYAKDDADLNDAMSDLSRMILAPVAAHLAGKNLLVVADGALHYIPFAALPVPETRGRIAASPRLSLSASYIPLVVEHEIVMTASASTLALLRKELAGRKIAPRMIAVLADPVFDRRDERLQAAMAKRRPAQASATRGLAETSEILRAAKDAGLVDSELELPRLPATRREAEAIAALVPASSRFQALDFDASRATATSPDLSQYRYVHFATHGILNSRYPELSGVVLSLFDEQGRERDGFLRGYEVLNLRLPAELVVLSGCRTGLGKEVRGEGLVGLTRAFMYAGAARVAVSLWDVSDEGTAELMARFYRGMLGPKRLRPAEALRAAQIEMWKETRWHLPYYWASFVLQGEPR